MCTLCSECTKQKVLTLHQYLKFSAKLFLNFIVKEIKKSVKGNVFLVLQRHAGLGF